MHPSPPTIVVTGGPGGGKTTAADLLRRELGPRIAVVPEAATLLFSGGFPRLSEPVALCAAQRAIYAVQSGLETSYAVTHRDGVLLCDRGTVDGAAYWPDGPTDFFQSLGTTLDKELARYDAVLFFESAAFGGYSIESGNRVRNEDNHEAIALDLRLRELWSGHPAYHFVAHAPSFMAKMANAVERLRSVVNGHINA